MLAGWFARFRAQTRGSGRTGRESSPACLPREDDLEPLLQQIGLTAAPQGAAPASARLRREAASARSHRAHLTSVRGGGFLRAKRYGETSQEPLAEASA